jgi:hypothetical protein
MRVHIAKRNALLSAATILVSLSIISCSSVSQEADESEKPIQPLTVNIFAADPVVESVSTAVKESEDSTTVEVTFTVSDADEDAAYHIAVFGHDTVTRAHYPMATFVEGDIFNQTFVPGTHTVTWEVSADVEAVKDLTNVVAYVLASDSGKVAAGRYLIIDVSGGTMASSYPVEYKTAVDVTKDIFKTDKIALRELPDGGWMGVYEVTQRQYELVTGATPSSFSSNPMRPVERVSWADITGRGAYDIGFMSTLRSKAGLTTIDLPDERQWEYACRSGATNDFNDYTQNRGGGASDEATMQNLGWCSSDSASDSGSRTHNVGEKQANAWGLYDMHGNVVEWTTTPFGVRIVKGGDWGSDANSCSAGSRFEDDNPNSRHDTHGFRLALPTDLKRDFEKAIQAVRAEAEKEIQKVRSEAEKAVQAARRETEAARA